MTVETHLHVVLDEDGNPAAAFRSRDAAREAVDSESYRYDHVTDCWPDVPLMEADR